MTRAVGQVDHGEVIQSPDMTGKPVSDLPLGSGLEGAVLHLDPPGLLCLDNQLEKEVRHCMRKPTIWVPIRHKSSCAARESSWKLEI